MHVFATFISLDEFAIKNDWQDDLLERADEFLTSIGSIKEKIEAKAEEKAHEAFLDSMKNNPFLEELEHYEADIELFKSGNHKVETVETALNNYEKILKKSGEISGGAWNKKFKEIFQIPKVETLNNFEMQMLREKFHSAEKKKEAIKEKKNTGKYKNKIAKDQKIYHENLLTECGEVLQKAISNWQLQYIEEQKRKFLEEMREWLDKLKELFKFTNDCGFDPGLFFDLSSGAGALMDFETIKKWLDIINNDPKIKELLKMLGRMRQVAESMEIEKIRYSHNLKIPVPNINSKEEIIGIKFGNDIENVIPSELALLSDTHTEILFDLKFVEKRLMCFDMQGTDFIDRKEEKEKEEEVKKEKEKGPIIMCIDTSGSMHGAPETLAKAVALYMCSMARKEKRNCYLISFSTAITTFDLSYNIGMEKLIEFLQHSFHGGTDATPALEEIANQVETEKYEDADALIISDFIMGSPPDTIRERIVNCKKNKGTKLHALIITNEPKSEMDDIYDKAWIYDSTSSRVEEIIGFCDFSEDN